MGLLDKILRYPSTNHLETIDDFNKKCSNDDTTNIDNQIYLLFDIEYARPDQEISLNTYSISRYKIW